MWPLDVLGRNMQFMCFLQWKLPIFFLRMPLGNTKIKSAWVARLSPGTNCQALSLLPVSILALFEKAADFTLTLLCLHRWFWFASVGKHGSTKHRINLDLFWLQALCKIVQQEHLHNTQGNETPFRKTCQWHRFNSKRTLEALITPQPIHFLYVPDSPQLIVKPFFGFLSCVWDFYKISLKYYQCAL